VGRKIRVPLRRTESTHPRTIINLFLRRKCLRVAETSINAAAIEPKVRSGLNRG